MSLSPSATAPGPLSDSFNVADGVLARYRLAPDDPAIVTTAGELTYHDLWSGVEMIARRLADAGCGVGEHVGISMVQTPLHIATVLAIARIGAISIPLHPGVPVERRRLAAQRFKITRILSGMPAMALDGLPFHHLPQLGKAATGDDTSLRQTAADAPFRIAFSSGTSGDPKGMLLSHGQFLRRAFRVTNTLDEKSRVLPLDINFGIGLVPALGALLAGGSVLLSVESDVASTIDALVNRGVTHGYLSPAQARRLVSRIGSGGLKCPDLRSLRIVGGHLPGDVLIHLKQRVTPQVSVAFGTTESGIVTLATPEILSRKPGSAGTPCPWARIEIVDADQRPLPPGTPGRLRIRSEAMVDGYVHDAARSARHFADGWYYPGDRGYFDDEGLLFIEGRDDDLLNVDGLKIDPEDIETQLCSHPSVREAAVFVAEDPDGNQILSAAVILTDPADVHAVAVHARERLGSLAPRRLVVVKSLPRTATHKLRRHALASLSGSDTSKN